MNSWKVWVAVLGLLLIAALLYPRAGKTVVATDGPEEITFWSPGSASQALQTAVEDFERRNAGKYRVVVGNATVRDATGDATRFLLGVAGGNPPDLIVYDRFAVVEAASRGAFHPLNEFIARDAADPRAVRAEDYYAPMWVEPQWQGKQYGVPISVDTRVLLINDDALQRAGFAENGKIVPPRTWEDLCLKKAHVTAQVDADRITIQDDMTLPGLGKIGRAGGPITRDDVVSIIGQDSVFRARVAEVIDERTFTLAMSGEHGSTATQVPAGMRGNGVQVKVFSKDSYTVRLTRFDERGKIVTLGFSPLFGNSWLYIFGWQNGAQFMSADGRTCMLDEPAVKEALQFVVDCYDAMGGYDRVKGFEGSFLRGAQDPFLVGRVSMKIDGNWFLDTIASFKPDMRFTAAPGPIPQARLKAGHKPITWAGGWAYAIPATAKNKEGGWKLLKYLASPEGRRVYEETNAAISRGRGKPYLPALSTHKAMQTELRETYMMNNPQITPRLLAAYDLYAEMTPESRFRPITPVGQKLWVEHALATQLAAGHQLDVHAALTAGARTVQREADKFFNPPRGTPVNWSYIISIYGLALIGVAGFFAWSEVRRRRMRLGRRDWVAGYVSVSPWLLGFVVLGAGPILFSLVISFCRYDVLSPAEFVGLANYKQLLGFHTDATTGELTANMPDFWTGLKNTGFMILAVPLGISAGLLIAMLLSSEIKGMAVFRTLFYLPAIVPSVAAFLIWLWVFDAQRGVINSSLEFIGIRQPPLWLQSETWAKPALIIMGLWGVGSGMLIWLAGIKGIPPQLYEAAEIDGAGPIRRFFHVTLPMLSPYILFNTIMGMIGTFQVFEAAYIMTDGGPGKATLFYVYALFNEAFRYLNMGVASAMAWVLFIVVLALTMLNLWASKRWVHYD